MAASTDLSRLRHRIVADSPRGRVYLLHDSEADSYITALDAKTGQECGARPAGDRPSAVLLDDAMRGRTRSAPKS